MTQTSSVNTTDKDSFAKAVMQRLVAKGWMPALSYDPDKFSIDLGSGLKIYLDNSYADWIAAIDDAGRSAVLDKLTTLAFQSSKQDSLDFEKVASNILPAVRSRTQIDNMWMTIGAGKDMFAGACQPLGDWLTVVLTVNTADGIGIQSAKQLKDWGKSFDEVLALGLENLAAFKKPVFESKAGGFYVLSSGDVYDPSVLLTHEAFANLSLNGAPVAVAATRNCVTVAGSEDATALAAMADYAEQQYKNDPRAISYMPLLLENGKWKPFKPATGLFPKVDRLRNLEFLNCYRNQMNILDDFNKKAGHDIYVGQLDAVQNGDELVTWASLVDGIETWLPIADVVIIAPANLQNPFARRFDDLMTVAGQTPLVPDTWPPLYVFKDGLEEKLSKFLRDRYPQPKEFPEIGKS